MEHCPECGYSPKKNAKPRSVPQHRRFFALIKAAMYHWPESHGFKPTSEDHLRKWLTAKAGHRTIQTIDTEGMSVAQATAAISAQVGKSGPWTIHCHAGTRFYSITPDSIDFDSLPHLAACALFDDVAEIIEVETGIRCDEMIKHTPRTSKAYRAPEVAA